MKVLKAKDIERLENTSVASAAAAAAASVSSEIICDLESCHADSGCQISCVATCAVTEFPNTWQGDAADAPNEFVGLLRAALFR